MSPPSASRILPLVVLVYALTAGCSEGPSPAELARRYGVAEVPAEGIDIETGFSQARIRDDGTVRSLYFVDDSGREQVESRIDLERPHRLEVPYTRRMFAGLLFFDPDPESVLLIGIGAGSMVRFLDHHATGVEIDALDIDPVVVDIADRYFGTRPRDGVRFLVADGFEFIRTAERRYDLLFLDAFLEPSAETDSNGIPLHLKEVPFYRAMRERLSDEGVVVFNLHVHGGLEEDVAGIAEAFGSLAVFSVASNVVVVATRSGEIPERTLLEERARDLDRRIRPESFTFGELVESMVVRRPNG